jgi:ABC-type bacteriocin/lantibiotic exporter with double-glycine peptidase domain
MDPQGSVQMPLHAAVLFVRAATLPVLMAATERHIRSRPRRDAEPVPAPALKRAERPEAVGAVIDFQNVVKTYDSGDMGLAGATLAIHPGEFVFIVGASGSGN